MASRVGKTVADHRVAHGGDRHRPHALRGLRGDSGKGDSQENRQNPGEPHSICPASREEVGPGPVWTQRRLRRPVGPVVRRHHPPGRDQPSCVERTVETGDLHAARARIASRTRVNELLLPRGKSLRARSVSRRSGRRAGRQARSSPAPPCSPWVAWEREDRFSWTPKARKTKRTKPEQSKPVGEAPPYRYGVPTYSFALSRRDGTTSKGARATSWARQDAEPQRQMTTAARFRNRIDTLRSLAGGIHRRSGR